MIRQLAFAALLVVSVSFSLAATAPAKVSIQYELKKGGLALGSGVETFTRDGESYLIESEARGLGGLLGTLKRRSEGSIAGSRLRPDLYQDQRNGKAYATARFDWKTSQVTLQREGRSKKVMEIKGETHDPLSFAYSFALRSMPAEQIDFSLADGRRSKPHRLVLRGREKLSTPMGELDTLHYAEREEDGSVTEFWLSTSHSLLPVRVLYLDEDGAALDQVATKITFQG
jgi:Protein of unknown function (DUF3108)